MEYQVSYRLTPDDENGWLLQGIYTSLRTAKREAAQCYGQVRIDVFDGMMHVETLIATTRLIYRDAP